MPLPRQPRSPSEEGVSCPCPQPSRSGGPSPSPSLPLTGLKTFNPHYVAPQPPADFQFPWVQMQDPKCLRPRRAGRLPPVRTHHFRLPTLPPPSTYRPRGPRSSLKAPRTGCARVLCAPCGWPRPHATPQRHKWLTLEAASQSGRDINSGLPVPSLLHRTWQQTRFCNLKLRVSCQACDLLETPSCGPGGTASGGLPLGPPQSGG